MAVTTTNSRVSYTGDGISTVFQVPFYFLTNPDLKVYVGGDQLSTGYTVTGAGIEDGGSVEITPAPAANAPIVILRDPDTLQQTRLPPNDPFPSSSVEDMVDKLTMIVQRHGDLLGRAPILADSDVDGAGAYRANQNRMQDLGDPVNSQDAVNLRTMQTAIANFLVDGAGDSLLALLANSTDFTLGVSLVGGAGRIVDSVAQLLQLPKTGSKTAFLRGYWTPGDNGGGPVYLDETDTTTPANGVTVFVAADNGRWKRTQTSVLDIRQGGAKGNGSTLDTSRIQATMTAMAGRIVNVSAGTYLVDAAIALESNTTVNMAPGAVFQCSVGTVSILSATNKTNVNVYGGTLQYTVATATGLNGGVALISSTYCTVRDVKFVGMQFSGVFLNNSNSNCVENCTISGTLGTHSDANDICVYNNSSFNRIVGNKCYGTGANGILHQGTVGSTPFKNQIIGNYVTQKSGYGIIVYLVTPANTRTIVSDNYVTDIQGSSNSGTTGSGIYIQSAGGTIVEKNVVENCCVQTTSSVNLPAGISIAFDVSAGPGLDPVVVSENSVSTAKFSAIAAANCRVSIINNQYVQSTDTAAGSGILVQDCSHSHVKDNSVRVPAASTRPGISVSAVTATQTNNAVTGNNVSGGNGIMFNIFGTGSFKWQGVISGNTMSPAGTSAQGMILTLVDRTPISGNSILGGAVGIGLTSVTNCRGSGNTIATNVSNRILTAGTCSNTHFDDSNDLYPVSPQYIQNQVAGVNITQRWSNAPGAGYWQVGDRIENSSPAVGQPKGWRCTSAGVPGTWVSEGNL